jgi:hypothetical protein
VSKMENCTPGTSIGSFVIQSPNRSTVAVVGSSVDVSWSFTPMVRQRPAKVDISLQRISQDGPKTFPIVISRNESAQEHYSWLIQPLNDGEYQLRVGTASRDPLLNPNACLQNGEAIGASSAIFKLVNPKGSPPMTADKFGPKTSWERQTLRGLQYLWMTVFLALI